MSVPQNYRSVLQDNYIYISHLDDDDMKYWILPASPDTVSDSTQSTFSQTNALGRSAPVFTYSNSGPRQVQVELAIHRDMLDDLNDNGKNPSIKLEENEDYIENLIHALQSISVPKYNLSNKAVEPPLVALRLCDEIFIKGVVVTPPSLTYGLPIIEMANGKSKYANVRFSITIAEVDPYDAQSVYTNGSFRGVVGLLKNKNMGFGEE